MSDAIPPDDPELLRRIEVFRAQLRPSQAVPVLHLPDAPPATDLQRSCVSCSATIAGGFRCPTCAEAARRALAEGPLPQGE